MDGISTATAMARVASERTMLTCARCQWRQTGNIILNAQPAPSGRTGRDDACGDQSPFDARARDQMRLKVWPSSSSNRLA